MKKTNQVYITKPNLRKRILAKLLDFIIYISLIVLAINILNVILSTQNLSFDYSFIMFPVIVLYQLYFTFIEGVFGATIGHAIFGLQVITTEREDISIDRALKRHMWDPVDIFMIIPGILSIKQSPMNQRFGDEFAGTIVIDKRDPEQSAG